MMAAHDISVVGVDYNKELIATLQQGKTTYEEAGLEELYKKACEKGIKFATEYISTDFYIIAVPTPYNKFSKKIDPSYVISAIKDVIKVCLKGATIVIESTVSPGTIDRFVRPAIEGEGFIIGEHIHIAHAPERIIPGNMVYELEHNSRVIGADNKEVGKKVKAVYSSFCKGDIVITDIRSAEMSKIVENTYRDINIAYANELAKICRQDNMDVYEIIRIANMHPRVNILQPGPGVGGHCISVDPWFLVGDYPGLTSLIRHARLINDSMPEYVLKRVHDIMQENGIKDVSRVGLYGLTYKENVDDIRESPTLQLLEQVALHLGSPIKVYDPMVSKDVVSEQYHNFDTFLSDIDIVVIMVGHKEILENLDKLSGKVVLDTRNICQLPGAYKL
jgi:UDP-N-acetyl-D-mannosaminuronic acid dehydrogenase